MDGKPGDPSLRKLGISLLCLVAGLAILAGVQSLFFRAAPQAENTTPAIVKEMHLQQSTPAPSEDVNDKFKCHGDDECVLTGKHNACGLKSMFAGKPSNGKCVCLRGPVFFGCMPKDQAAMYKNQ